LTRPAAILPDYHPSRRRLVFRRDNNADKAGGLCHTTSGTLAVFAVFGCFCSKLSAIDIAFSAEILDRHNLANERTAETPLFFCCFRCSYR